MTPTVGWSEQDYYRASRAARRAWQATNAQLELGFNVLAEPVVVDRRAGTPGPVRSDATGSASTDCGLDDQDVARADHPGCGVLIVEPAGTHPLPAAGSTSRHTNGGAAPVPSDERGIPGKEHRR